MFINLRDMASPSSSGLLDISIEDSRVDSNTSKRFTRKKQPLPEHGRLRPRHDPNHTHLLKKKSSPTLHSQEMFLDLAQIPAKYPASIPLISSDRATQSTVIRNRCQTQTGVAIGPSDLTGELQMRGNEIMMLEDENMRLKRDLQKKDEEMAREANRREREFIKLTQEMERQLQAVRQQLEAKNEQLERINAELRAKNEQLRIKNEQIKLLKKAEQGVSRELKAVKYDKILLQKQLQQLYLKKLPKEIRELMSYREVSLMRQLEELKERVGSCRTVREEEMEKQIYQLQQDAAERQNRFKNMEIHGRVLSRKVRECERDLHEKIQTFSKCYATLKDSHSQLMDQLKRARKENIKLKHLQQLEGVRKRRQSISPQSDSLSLSLSSRQQRRGRKI